MLFFLITLYSSYKGSVDHYKKMIASYLIYTHLFNSFCATKMASGWNGGIKNLYVNIYKINAMNTKEPNIDESKLSKLEMFTMGQHAENIDADSQNFENFGDALNDDRKMSGIKGLSNSYNKSRTKQLHKDEEKYTFYYVICGSPHDYST